MTIPRLPLSEYLQHGPPETKWMWEGWFAVGDVVVLGGPAGVGKSLFTLSLAAHLIHRSPLFLGRPLAGEPRVLMMDWENPLDLVLQRMHEFGLRGEELSSLWYSHYPELDLAGQWAREEIEAAVELHRPSLCVIDSFRRAAPRVSENESGEVATAFDPLLKIAREWETTMLVVHHHREHGRDMNALRGSTDFTGVADSILNCFVSPGGFTVTHGKSRRGMKQYPISVQLLEHLGQMYLTLV
jgi:RecA-family ATPase